MNEKLIQALSVFSDENLDLATSNGTYLPLLVTYTKEDAEINGLRKAKSTDKVDRIAEYFSALEVLDQKKCVIFIGEKGMGKSTFLRELYLCMAGELAGDPQYNLAKITEAVIRTDKGNVPETQSWSAGALRPFWFNAKKLADNCGSEKHLPQEVTNAQLVLIDGIEDVKQADWEWMGKQISELHQQKPEIFFALACEADVVNRLRPRLSGFTCFSVKSLNFAQKRQIAASFNQNASADALDEMAANNPAGLADTLSITQNYLLWMEMGQKETGISSFYENAVVYYQKKFGYSDNQLGKTAFSYFTGKLSQKDSKRLVESLGNNINILRYLACEYCLSNEFGKNFGELANQLGFESWSIIRTLKSIIREGNSADFFPFIVELCPDGDPEEKAAIQALFSAELMFEIRNLVNMTDDTFLRRLQIWMSAIISNNWLTIYDRITAGKRLSWLGDDRDFTALVNIPAGSFTMGDYLLPNNQPVETLQLDGFKIGLYPVVNSLYREFITKTGRNWLSDEKDNCERQNYPAINLTWHDAVAFCDWLTNQWRAEGKIKNNEFVRLPTEAEWEYAARGKMSSEKDTYYFSWGNEWEDDSANTQELGLNDTCTVGIFPKNVSCFGCHDMNGMVWEWNSTLWGTNPKLPDYPYPYTINDGREKYRTAPDEIRRCMRGGSFGSTADHATCTYRGGLEPIGFWRGDGFRIVVSEKQYGE